MPIRAGIVAGRHSPTDDGGAVHLPDVGRAVVVLPKDVGLIATVERTRRQLVEEGFEAVLARKYNSNSARPRIFDGVAEAKLIALTLSPAPEGFARWSLRLLEEKVVELHIVERASDNTIGRTLKKTFSSRTCKSNGSFHRMPTRRL